MRQILVTVGKPKTDFTSFKTMKYGFIEKYGFGKVVHLKFFDFQLTETFNLELRRK
jgi:hypothetical protein